MIEPPCTDRYARWWGRSAVNHRLLPDSLFPDLVSLIFPSRGRINFLFLSLSFPFQKKVEKKKLYFFRFFSLFFEEEKEGEEMERKRRKKERERINVFAFWRIKTFCNDIGICQKIIFRKKNGRMSRKKPKKSV